MMLMLSSPSRNVGEVGQRPPLLLLTQISLSGRRMQESSSPPSQSPAATFRHPRRFKTHLGNYRIHCSGHRARSYYYL